MPHTEKAISTRSIGSKPHNRLLATLPLLWRILALPIQAWQTARGQSRLAAVASAAAFGAGCGLFASSGFPLFF